MSLAQAAMGGPSDPSGADQTTLDAYVQATLELANMGVDGHYRWTLAGTTWALTGDALGLERHVLPSLGSDIQRVAGRPALDLCHIHWVEVGAARHRLSPPQVFNAGDADAVDVRRTWLSDRVRVEYQARTDLLTVADLSKAAPWFKCRASARCPVTNRRHRFEACSMDSCLGWGCASCMLR